MIARQIGGVLEKVYNIILILLTVSMFIIVGYNVFMRFVINQSVGWADELSRFLFIWTSFIGAVIAFRDDEHVGLSFAVDKIKSQGIRRIIAVLQQVLILLVLGVLTWNGYVALGTVMNVSPALSIPMSVIYAVIPVTGFLMFLIGIGKVVLLLSGVEVNFDIRNSVE